MCCFFSVDIVVQIDGRGQERSVAEGETLGQLRIHAQVFSNPTWGPSIVKYSIMGLLFYIKDRILRGRGLHKLTDD